MVRYDVFYKILFIIRYFVNMKKNILLKNCNILNDHCMYMCTKYRKLEYFKSYQFKTKCCETILEIVQNQRNT